MAADNANRAQEAKEQIKENEYAKAYFIKGKPIEGVGLSFSHDARNIEYFVQEKLFTPSILIYG